MKQLLIAPGLSLPLDAVTSTLIAYGGKGMGKTNLGSVLVEELTRCGLRWAWLDPLGVSWGLRHSADGAGPGVECLILGGLHGDVPIEPAGGAAVADVVVEESTNVLVDFSRKTSGEMWTIGEKIRFVTAYALRLFQRQGEIVSGRRRDPLFQVLDEAARYIPQVIPSGAKELAESVGAWNQLVEEGRNVGVGVGLLTQRSARMAKSVSELADAMFAFRTVGPNSLTAILDWLGEHIEKERIKDLAATVRSLERGHALVVSPGWLKFEGVVKVRMRETFDSSATVKHGERQKTARGEGTRRPARACARSARSRPPSVAASRRRSGQRPRPGRRGASMPADRFRAGKRLWSDEDEAILVARYPHEPTPKIARALRRSLSAVYGRAGILGLTKSAEYLASADACRLRRGDNVGAAARFKKGHVPANKGLRRPGWGPGRMKETQFKKGKRSGVAARNWRPVGTVLSDADGYLRIKVREAQPGEAYGFGNPAVWPQLHRHIWEAAHGPMPKGYVLAFRNGDKRDIRLDNLQCLSRRELMARNTVHTLPKPLAETIQLLGALNRQIRRRTRTHEEQDRRPA